MNVAFPFFAMELLSDGWLFVLPSDVLLSANRHKLKRIRVNATKSDRLLDHVHERFNDIGSVSELCQCVTATLLDLEKCDSLDVYREPLPREFKQCFEGDFTPLVLIQFMCAGYLKIERIGRGFASPLTSGCFRASLGFEITRIVLSNIFALRAKRLLGGILSSIMLSATVGRRRRLVIPMTASQRLMSRLL